MVDDTTVINHFALVDIPLQGSQLASALILQFYPSAIEGGEERSIQLLLP